jgi:hypothetical protein
MTGGSLTTLEDTGATFVTDGVAVGDYILNDSLVTIGVVSAVTSETALAIVAEMRDPNDGFSCDPNVSGNTYRVVTNASTGASIFHINGLGSLFTKQEEFVVLNGLSNVATLKTWTRQFRARVFGPGTTGGVGVITSTAQTEGTLTCQVINGNNQTLMAIATIPSDKNGYVKSWWGSLSKKQVAVSTIILRVGELDGIGYIIQTRAIDNTGSSSFNYPWPVNEPMPGGSDIWVEADTDANGTGVSAGFEIIFVDK